MPTSNLIPATRSHNRISASSVRQAILLTTTFLFGVVVCSAFFLWHAHNNDPLFSSSTSQFHLQQHYHWRDKRLPSQQNEQSVAAEKSLRDDNSTSSSILDGLRVLVTIASFDFMQLAHLEEVLDGFQDLCYAGSMVDIVVYTTVMVRDCSSWSRIVYSYCPSWVGATNIGFNIVARIIFLQSIPLHSLTCSTIE
jgi:hypothetical protein